MTRYTCLIRQKVSVASLFHIKMKRRESIREFMKHFDTVILQLESVNIELIMQAVKEVIQPNRHFFRLTVEPPGLVDDLFLACQLIYHIGR